VAHHRAGAVASVLVAVPGERWEIDVLTDGRLDFERFVSSGDIAGGRELSRLITNHTHPDPA
jgi:hypothetical protein